MNDKRRQFRLWLAGVLAILALGSAWGQTCGAIPAAYPLYGAALNIGTGGKINGQVIATGNYTFSGVNPNTGAIENVLPTFPAIQPAFPAFSSTTDTTLGANGNLNSGIYRTVTVNGSNATMSGNFQIKTLALQGVALTLAGGDLFVETLTLAGGASISASRQVRIFVKTLVSVDGNNVNLNGGGTLGNFQLYLHSGSRLSAAGRTGLVLGGMIYGNNADIDLGASVAAIGVAVTSGSLTFGSNAAFSYSAANQGSISQISTCTGIIAEYKFEEKDWKGAAGEVKDSSGRNLDAQLVTTARSNSSPVSLPTAGRDVPPNVPTIAQSVQDQGLGFSINGDFCRAGYFDGNGVVEAPASTLFDLTTQHSAMAWIFPTAAPSSGIYSILSNDQNYEFHLDSNRKLYWWWGPNFTSRNAIPLNNWTHIAITYAQGKQIIYINGQPDPNTDNETGVLNASGCKFHIGGDVSTGPCSLISSRNFHGLIDEAKVFNTTLTQAQVQAYMKQGRACTPPARFLIAVTTLTECSKQITITAVDADNNTLTAYDGTINLSTSSSHGDWSLQAGNGLLSSGLADSGEASYSFRPINGDAGVVALILSGSRTENLTIHVVDSTNAGSRSNSSAQKFKPCLFNCVESKPYVPDAQVRSGHLYTKVAGESFGFDVVALTGIGVPNQNYNQQVKVEMVDAGDSALGCATWPAVSDISNLPTTFSFSPSGDKGRKILSGFIANSAYKNLRCRVTIATTGEQACSTDNFSIRPADFSVTAAVSSPLAAGDASNMPTSGGAFTLVATARTKASSPATAKAYTGVPRIDQTLVAASSSGPNIAGTITSTYPTVSGKAAFPAASNGVSTGSYAFAYSEVGRFGMAADAVYDDAWTGVDQGSDCTDGFNNGIDSSGKYGCKFGNTAPVADIGRFIPGGFVVIASSLSGACLASGFIYMDQPFDLGFTLKAVARNGQVTQNFDQNYLLAAGSGLPFVNSPSAYGAAYLTAVNAGVDSAARVTHSRLGSGTGRILSVAATPATWTKGVLDGAAIAMTAAKYVKSATPPSATDDLPREAMQFGLRVDSGSDSIPMGVASIGAQTRIRYGRLWLSNAFGSELLPLRVPVLAQYWNKGWQLNRLDNCTALTVPTSGNGGLAFYPASARNALSAGETTASMGGTPAGTLVVGDALLTLSAPGKDNYGFVDIVGSKLGAAAYLPPSNNARACFGTCGPRSSVIFSRERY